MVTITAKEIAKLLNRSQKYVYILFKRKGINLKDTDLEAIIDLICKYRWHNWALKAGIKRSYSKGCSKNYAKRLIDKTFKPMYDKCYKKDNYQCTICLNRDNLVIHHRDFNHYNMELDNMMTVCWECHLKIHSFNFQSSSWWSKFKTFDGFYKFIKKNRKGDNHYES